MFLHLNRASPPPRPRRPCAGGAVFAVELEPFLLVKTRRTHQTPLHRRKAGGGDEENKMRIVRSRNIAPPAQGRRGRESGRRDCNAFEIPLRQAKTLPNDNRLGFRIIRIWPSFDLHIAA